ncbi:hypothetical protein DIPPA_11295 [Diplonema papillatum]|nr:hypothetical protein DIPPA_11295 [Diplonema papillatum]
MADDEDSGNETASDRGSVVSGVSGMDTDAESSGEDAEEEEAKAAPVSDRPPAIGGWGQRTVVAKRKVDAPAGGGAAKRQKLDETVGLSAVGGIMEQARLATLQREAGADAFNAQGHAALVKFLEPHFQNEAVAPVLRAARERFCEHCTLGPKQWALWIAHEKLLGDETLPRKQYVLQLLQKANEDFLCVRLLVEQCEYLNEVLELSLEVNQRADDDEEDAKRVESVRNQYEQALQRGVPASSSPHTRSNVLALFIFRRAAHSLVQWGNNQEHTDEGPIIDVEGPGFQEVPLQFPHPSFHPFEHLLQHEAEEQRP